MESFTFEDDIDDQPDEICCQYIWLYVGRVRVRVEVNTGNIEDYESIRFHLACVDGAADVFGFNQGFSILGNVYQMSK